MEGVRMILLCSFFIILHSCYHCLAQPPFTIPQGSLAVLPAGFSRAQNEPFTSTKLPFSELSSSSGQILQNASQTPFIAFDAHFASILGNNPTIRTLAERDFAFAVGGARYLQPSNELFFTSGILTGGDGSKYSNMYAVNIDTGVVRQVPSCPQATTPAGATLYQGKLIVLQQGRLQENGTVPGGILEVDPYTGQCNWLLNSFLGLQFNSPNGPTVTSRGVIFFADNSLAYSQGLKGPPQMGNYIWRIAPTSGHGPRVVADGFITPVGTALSPDERTLFVTDIGAQQPVSSVQGPRTTYAFDIAEGNDWFLENRRVFAYTDVGAPSGDRIDNFGNVYAGTGDGVSIWNPQGALIGKILIDGGAQSITIGGPLQNVLLVTMRTRILRIDFSGITTNTSSQINQNG